MKGGAVREDRSPLKEEMDYSRKLDVMPYSDIRRRVTLDPSKTPKSNPELNLADLDKGCPTGTTGLRVWRRVCHDCVLCECIVYARVGRYDGIRGSRGCLLGKLTIGYGQGHGGREQGAIVNCSSDRIHL